MSDDTRRTSRKFAQKAATDADQVEAVAFRDGVARVGDGLTDELIAGAPMAEESEIPHNPNGNAEWLDDDALVEVATGGVADELLRRAELLGPEYPFDLSPDGSHLEYRSERSKSGAYEFCLALCETPHDINKLPHCRAVREFDRFVGRALAGHFGPGTEFYRFGVPGEPEDRRPGKIGDAIRELGRRTRGEWEFTQRLGRDAQADQGDGGIDIVVWKPFGSTDDRIGIPFVLAQCGCGEQALQETKWQDLQLAKFERKYNVRVASASDGVIRYFALPYHLPDSARWRAALGAGGVVLDRIRLTWMAETYLNREEDVARLRPHTDSLLSPLVHTKKPVTPPAKPAVKKRRPSPGAAGRRSPPE